MSEANRECRDIICLILFVAMCCAMVYMSAYGYTNGNLARVFRATDMNGIVCGEPGGVAENFPFAYFFNPTSADLTNRYCVDVCPTFVSGTLTTINCYGVGSCIYALTITSTGTYTVNPTSTGQIIGYDSSELIGRVCIPSSEAFAGVFTSYAESFSSSLSQSSMGSFITDL
jgi:hypothetical protein